MRTRRRKRVLLAPGIGSGHVLPFLAMAAELRRRGHPTLFYAEPGVLGAAQRMGCDVAAMPVKDAYRRLLACTTTAQVIAAFGPLAERVASHLCALLETAQVDLALVDALHLGAALAVQRAGLPWASLATTPWLLSPDVGATAQALIPTRALRKRLGLPPSQADGIQQAISRQLHLLPWTPRFDVGPAPRGAVHVGPLNFESKAPRGFGWIRRLKDRPVVLVSASTVPFRALQGSVDYYVNESIRALNELPVHGVVTLAEAHYAVSTAPAPHVRIEGFVPHSLLMPRLAALVMHGGWGTISRAFSAGVPMVIVPFALDQTANAELCENQGVAFSLPVQTLTAEALYSRIKTLLTGRSDQQRSVQALARELARKNSARMAVEKLLRV